MPCSAVHGVPTSTFYPGKMQLSIFLAAGNLLFDGFFLENHVIQIIKTTWIL